MIALGDQPIDALAEIVIVYRHEASDDEHPGQRGLGEVQVTLDRSYDPLMTATRPGADGGGG